MVLLADLNVKLVVLISWCNTQVLASFQSERDQTDIQLSITGERKQDDPIYSYVVNSEELSGDTRPSAVDKHNIFKGYSARTRKKRAATVIGKVILVGMRAVKRLLIGTQMISKNDAMRVFLKDGGYKQAEQDFHSVVNPKLVQTFGIHKRGTIGDRTISLEGNGKNGQATLVIQKPPEIGSPGSKVDVIIYNESIKPS